MNNFMKCKLYGASIARMDSGTYASLYIGQDVVNEDEENAKGISIMKLSCEPKVYDSLNSSKYPVDVRIEVRLQKAAGGKMGQRCVGLTLESDIPAHPKKAS